VPAGRDRCSACGTIVIPPFEGALAPDPLSLTPPARGSVEPLREIPGLKKKERTWKDEVRERVHRRRRRRGDDASLPLFEGAVEDEPQARTLGDASSELPTDDASGVDGTAGLTETEDLPIRPIEEAGSGGLALDTPTLDEQVAEAVSRRRGNELLDEEQVASGEWGFDAAPPVVEPRPVERPAYPGERMQAAAIDMALLLALWSVVVYFASRAAHVSVVGLLPVWPYLAAYLAFLGLAYAGYFSGTTGQTLGKIALDLRVVDRAGQPPGYLRSFARAAIGGLGIGLAFAGVVPMFFDPARRAFHDRLFKTRVVRN
jgi:uncharacterized RDD family membrane protein YckC